MKLLKNKTVVGVIAIVIGILVCFILSPLYNKSVEQKTKIIRISADIIKKGYQITQDDIEIVAVGNYNLPDDVITDEAEIVGKYAKSDLYKNDYLTSEKLSSAPLSNNEYLEGLDGTAGAISITLQNFASGLSGKLQNGDIVSIIATNMNNNKTEIPPQLKYVKVLSCTTADGVDVDETLLGTNEGDENNKDLPTTVTLLVTDEQAMLLANLENTQKLHLELIHRGDETTADNYLEQQKNILNNISEELAQESINADSASELKESD